MRIAIVTNSFAEVGGAENNTQSLARHLLRVGDMVSIFVRAKEDVSEELRREFDVVRVDDEAFLTTARSFVRWRALKRRWWRRFREYDLVYFCMLQTALSFAPFLREDGWVLSCRGGDIQNPAKTPYKRLVEASQYGIVYKGFRTSWRNEFVLRIFFWWVRGVGHYITISDDMVRELVALGVSADRTRKVINGVDLARFRSVIESSRVEGEDVGRRRVLSVGRNDSRKGFYYLIGAAKHLRDRGVSDVVFWLRGRGLNDLRRFIEADGLQGYFRIFDGVSSDGPVQIRMDRPRDGHLPDEETIALLASSDVVVVPSIIEALSSAGVEAEAADKPLIVSDTFGCREFISRGTAVGVAPGDEAGLATAIQTVLDDSALRQRLARARHAFDADRDAARCGEQYRSYFQEIVANA